MQTQPATVTHAYKSHYVRRPAVGVCDVSVMVLLPAAPPGMSPLSRPDRQAWLCGHGFKPPTTSRNPRIWDCWLLVQQHSLKAGFNA